MADSTIKPDSGNDLVLQNNGGTGKIEINDGAEINVTIGSSTGDDFNVSSGKLLVEGDNSDVSTTGTFKGNFTAGSGKTIDVSAGTLTLANDQISGDKISGGTIGAGTFDGTIGANAVFPTGVVIQTVGDYGLTAGTPYAPSTISLVINNVLANSKVFGVAWSGQYYPGTGGVSYPAGYPTLSGGGISTTRFYIIPATGRTFNLLFYDDSPSTGTNTYSLATALGTSGFWAAAGGYAYGYTLMEIA